MRARARLGVVLAIPVVALVAAWLINPSLVAELGVLFDSGALQDLVARLGYWGPILIVLLMTLAVVASPIPSAPIAVAAGAAYGNLWGTVLVVIGAEAGALIAFGLARALGRDFVVRLFGERAEAGLLGSQTALTVTVFASRLMPFVSFDMISYAAGLSALHAWRFALATMAGIVPAAFVLAHVGGEAASGDLGRATWAVLALGLFTGLPLLWAALRVGGRARR